MFVFIIGFSFFIELGYNLTRLFYKGGAPRVNAGVKSTSFGIIP